MKIKYQIKLKIIISLIFIVFSTIITSIWFKEGLMFAGGEDQIPFYNIPRAKELFTSTWQDLGTGFPQIFNLPKTGSIYILNFFWELGVQGVNLQKIVFFTLIFIGTNSVALLCSNIISPKQKIFNTLIVSVFSGLLYFLNPFSMSQIWGRGLYFQFYFFALLPLSIYLLDGWIRYGKNINLVLVSFFTLTLSWSFGHPANFVSFIFANGAYALLRRFDKKILLKGLFWIINIVCINLYWIFPFIKHGNTLAKSISVNQDQISIFESLSTQSSITWVLRLMNRGNFSPGSQYGDYYQNPIIIFISIALAVLIILSFINYIKKKTNLGLVIIFAVGLLLSLGSNPPFGALIRQLFILIPELQVYRNSFEKAGILIIFPLSLMIGGLINNVSNFKKLLSLSTIIIFLVGGMLVKPIWTGKFSGGEIFRPWVKIPHEYSVTNDLLVSKNSDFRILQLPLLPGDGVKYNWSNYYQGIEASEFIFNNESIGRDVVVNQDYYTALLDRFGKTSPGSTLEGRGDNNDEFKRSKLSEEVYLLGVKYLILHKDIDTVFSGTNTLSETRKIIEGDANLFKVYENNLIEVYENKLGYKKLLKINNIESELQKSDIGFVLNNSEANNSIELNYLFNENWILRTDTHDYSPKRINDFNMIWRNYIPVGEIQLIFIPQITYVFWLKISLYYLLLINVIIIFHLIYKLRRNVHK